MGLCVSRANKNYKRLSVGSNDDHNECYLASSKIPHQDYRVDLIEAFVADIQQRLYHKYLLTEFDIFCIIPLSINDLILSYLSRYQVYGIRTGTIFTINKDAIIPLFTQLEIQNILPNPSLLSHASNNRLVMRSLFNDLYSISCDKYDDSSTNILDQTKSSYFMQLNPFQSMVQSDNNNRYIDHNSLKQQIEFISNGFHGIDDDKMFYKLKNGDIYCSNIISKTYKLQPILFNNKQENIIQIDCGQQHSLFLSAKGRVYAMGSNHRGQCGLNKYHKNLTIPTIIDTFLKKQCKISSISCGKNHSCCMVKGESISLYSWGCNQYKQCNPDSDGEMSVIWKPMIVQHVNHSKIKKAKCGKNSTIILYENGSVIALGDLSVINEMNKLPKNVKFRDFDVGTQNIILISSSDDIYSFGQYDKKNCYKLQEKMFPNLAKDSMVNSVIATPNNTIIVFN